MGDETLQGGSLLVTPLKQQALVKIAETLIFLRPELVDSITILGENYAHDINHMLFHKDRPWKWFPDIEQLCVPKCLQRDIRDVIKCICRNVWNFNYDRLVPASTFKFNSRGDVDVNRTYEDLLEHTLHSTAGVGAFPFWDLLEEACYFYQDRCVHLILCELVKWEHPMLETSLRNAQRVVEVQKNHCDWQCDTSFVIKNVDDPASWNSFVTMLNTKYFAGIEFSFEENTLSVHTFEFDLCFELKLLWPLLTTTQKRDYVSEFFQVALDLSDAALLVDTMRYLDSMDLIKTNLQSFILCFLTHPYYRRFLPDLQLVDEDMQLMLEENYLRVFDKLLLRTRVIGDFADLPEYFIQLWQYVSLRNKSIGNYVRLNIIVFLDEVKNAPWFLAWPGSDAKEAISKLHKLFPQQ